MISNLHYMNNNKLKARVIENYIGLSRIYTKIYLVQNFEKNIKLKDTSDLSNMSHVNTQKS